MKERPILFSAPMVRAILDGRKTVTRRIVKPVGNDDAFVLLDHGKWFWPYRSDDGESSITADGNETPHSCHYGRSGDRLWVREAFSGPHDQNKCPPKEWNDCDPIWYWADGNPEGGDWTKPKPSIHMPRWASRITLEIVSVRVERLQDISEEDAIAEGIYRESEDEIPFNGQWYINAGDSQGYATAKSCYAALWDSINGEGSWAKNPWVWVIEFRRIM